MRYRYSAWDGSQDPLGPDVAAADLLEELSDEVLMGGEADAALRRLLRRGCGAGSRASTRSAAGCSSAARKKELV